MTKTEAHEKFIKWIEAHPFRDGWVIHGGDVKSSGQYSAVARLLNPDVSKLNKIVIKYEVPNG